ncbi:MAG TPA: CAP domain-containing protein, partial [Actinomycetota bacterium]|nr:CAP domain-containing protein [Actinomycetota bacterium]
SGFTYKRAERCLMRRINRVRARHGLNRLRRDPQMAYVARRHAESMAASRGVWHDPNVGSEVTRWRRLGQNTGRGQSCKSLTRSFMNSSSHRAHILGRFRFFAVGVKRAGGCIYVQELFESRRDPGNVYHYP